MRSNTSMGVAARSKRYSPALGARLLRANRAARYSQRERITPASARRPPMAMVERPRGRSTKTSPSNPWYGCDKRCSP